MKYLKGILLIIVLGFINVGCSSDESNKSDFSDDIDTGNTIDNTQELLVGNWNLISYSIQDGVQIFNDGNEDIAIDYIETGSNFDYKTNFIDDGMIACDGIFDITRDYLHPDTGEILYSEYRQNISSGDQQEGFINYTWRIDGDFLFTLFKEPGTVIEYPSTIEDITETSLVIVIDLEQDYFTSSEEKGTVKMEYEKIF